MDPWTELISQTASTVIFARRSFNEILMKTKTYNMSFKRGHVYIMPGYITRRKSVVLSDPVLA